MSGYSKISITESLRKTIALEQRALADGGTLVDRNNTVNSIPYSLLKQRPSLVLTPSAIKESTIYSIIPNTASGDFTFTQNTANGTRFNQNGDIEVLPANTPRITWIDGEPFILVEEGKTNIVPFSQNLENAAFIKSNCTIVTDTSISPDGTTTTDTINQNTGTTATLISAPLIPNDNKVRTVSCFVKKENVDSFAVLLFRYQGGATVYGTSLQFNKRTGDFVTALAALGTTFNSAPLDSEVVSIGDYWLIYLTLANNLTGNNQIYFGLQPNRGTALNDLIQVDGNAESWGWSITEGNINSYIPTNGAIATRNDDIYTVTPPIGTLEIKEFLTDGTINTKTTIPATYQIPIGSYKKIVFYKSYIDAFVFVVKTDNVGTSGANQFTIPTTGGGYDYNIETDEHNLTGQTGNVTLTFAVAGTYTIKITGIFPQIYFNNGGDRLKLLEVLNQGDPSWNRVTQLNAFYGCSNLTTFGWNVNFMNELTNGFAMFRSTNISGALPSGMTLAALENGGSMFRSTNISGSLPSGMTLAALENGSAMFLSTNISGALPSGMTLALITDGRSMFSSTSISGAPSLDLAALTLGAGFFLNVTLNTTDYSNILIRTEISNPNNSVIFGGGNSQYNAAGQTARNLLTTEQLWNIADGGLEV